MTEENRQSGHRRRIHYRGTHPHTFEEKYKEQNPEKYQDEIEKYWLPEGYDDYEEDDGRWDAYA